MNERRIIRDIRRRIGLEEYQGILGRASDGKIDVDTVNRPGWVYVQQLTGAGFYVPALAFLGPNINMRMDAGKAILLGHNSDGDLIVKGPDHKRQAATGFNPRLNNGGDVDLNGWIQTDRIVPLVSHPTSPVSKSVMVRSYVYLSDRVSGQFAGTLVDLTSYIPSTGNQGLVGIFLKSDDSLEVCASTTQTMDEPIDLTDIQECVNGMSAGSRPIWGWLLKDGQTTITGATTQIDLRDLFSPSETLFDRSRFTQTATVTVGNTTTETTLTGSGEGSLSLPIRYLRLGTMVRLRASGYLSDTGTPTLDLKFKLGGTTICSTGAGTLVGTLSNHYWQAEIDLTCRSVGASGSVIAQGRLSHDDSSHAGTFYGMVSTGTMTVDTTAALPVDLSVTWGSLNALNTMSCTNLSLEILR